MNRAEIKKRKKQARRAKVRAATAAVATPTATVDVREEIDAETSDGSRPSLAVAATSSVESKDEKKTVEDSGTAAVIGATSIDDDEKATDPRRAKRVTLQTFVRKPGRSAPADCFVIQCPHCAASIVVELATVRCGWMRDGRLVKTGRQMHSGASEQECQRLIAGKLVTGCTGLFHVKLDRSTPIPTLVVT